MTATAVHSIEIELAWGWHDQERENRYESLSQNRAAETTVLEWLLTLGDKYEIPFTFDIVAHLLHSECNGSHAGPQPLDWFSADPGTEMETNPLFYAPDLVRMIQDAEVNHEICTHSFSHVLADDVGSEVVRWEVERAVDEHRDFGLPEPHSFVPPRHQCPSYDILRDGPIEVIRRPFGDTNELDGRLRRYLSTLKRQHPVGKPNKNHGIIETYTTTEPSLTAPYLPSGQRSAHWAYSVLPLSARQRLQQHYLLDGLESAIRQHSQVHYWTHLSNLSAREQQPPIEAYFRSIEKQKSRSNVMPIRMKDCQDLVVDE